MFPHPELTSVTLLYALGLPKLLLGQKSPSLICPSNLICLSSLLLSKTPRLGFLFQAHLHVRFSLTRCPAHCCKSFVPLVTPSNPLGRCLCFQSFRTGDQGMFKGMFADRFPVCVEFTLQTFVCSYLLSRFWQGLTLVGRYMPLRASGLGRTCGRATLRTAELRLLSSSLRCDQAPWEAVLWLCQVGPTGVISPLALLPPISLSFPSAVVISFLCHVLFGGLLCVSSAFLTGP